MKKIVLLSLVGLLILLFTGCGLIPFTTPGVEQPSIEEPPEVPEGLEIGLDPSVDLELAQSKGPTKHVPSDTGIGTWDSVNRIYTLTTDVNEGIVIDEDNLTLDGDGHTITGSGTGYGVYLDQRISVTVKNCVVSGFWYGIYLYSSSSNTLTANTANNNYDGIFLYDNSNYNTLTDNTANNNVHGISLDSSSSNTLTSNIMSDNEHNFMLYGSQDSEYDNDIDISNTVDGKPIYYIRNAVNQVYDSLTNAGTFYCINCENVVLRDLTLTKNYIGVFFWKTSNSRIENITVSENDLGIYLYSSSSNTLTANTANDNLHGIFLYSSSSNTLTANTANDNYLGLRLVNSNDNEVYNNFINNSMIQADVSGGSGNVFNSDKPIGGNYWSDHTSPDVDYDGFVDSAYIFTGGQDDLPWVCQDGWKPTGSTVYLITTVEDFGLPKGIKKSLTVLLEAAINALENHHEQAAIGQLTGFIHHVEAQNGKKLTEEQAQMLIATAKRIIDSIKLSI